MNVSRLSDAEGPIGRLILYSRAPPARQMNDVIGRRQRDSHPTGLGRQDHHVEPVRPALERIDRDLPCVAGDTAVDPGNVVIECVPAADDRRATAGRPPEKPPAAWTPEQVVALMMDRVAAGDFYILCPDNETTAEQDAKRMAWAAGDLIENRPALSRWHPDWRDAFAQFMEK